MLQPIAHYRVLEYKVSTQPRLRAQSVQSVETTNFKENESRKKTVDPDRADLLESIKSRLKKGFYNSDAVIDDLSSSFASVFNQKF